MATPQNTPSAKKAAEFSLKNIDFTNFLENRNNFDTNIIRHEREFCDPLFLGNTNQEFGYTKDADTPKVKNYNIRHVAIYFVRNVT